MPSLEHKHRGILAVELAAVKNHSVASRKEVEAYVGAGSNRTPEDESLFKLHLPRTE
jgi:hypothetical protein